MSLKNIKSLGQHWLYNRVILEEIAELAKNGVRAENEAEAENSNRGKTEQKLDTCLEIGPGLGTLTSSLLKRFLKVVAVEFDERLAKNLPGSFPGKNLEVVNEDILEFDFTRIEGEYVISGNIPYYITSPIIEKVLTLENRPERVVLLIQKEVAERILDEKETMLSLFVKNRARVYRGPVVPRAEFTPPPKVDSEVIVMEPKAPEVGEEVFELIRQGFRAPRKKLVHNLAGIKSKEEIEEVFREIGISEDARPGDLKLKDWEKLRKVI